ncbi:MAG: tetratricopeptide repeat protein [Opitutaceae bacterium]
MNPTELQALIEDATFDFTMGDDAAAVTKLTRALDSEPESFTAWHALAEVHFSARRFDQALAAAQKAHALQPDDIFVNTSLSRIWMECGNKEMAEKFGAAARMLGWKDSLQQDASVKKPGT